MHTLCSVVAQFLNHNDELSIAHHARESTSLVMNDTTFGLRGTARPPHPPKKEAKHMLYSIYCNSKYSNDCKFSDLQSLQAVQCSHSEPRRSFRPLTLNSCPSQRDNLDTLLNFTSRWNPANTCILHCNKGTLIVNWRLLTLCCNQLVVWKNQGCKVNNR